MHWIAPSERDTGNNTLAERLWANAEQFLLAKYAGDGELQFALPGLVRVPSILQEGKGGEIAQCFGFKELGSAMSQLQSWIETLNFEPSTGFNGSDQLQTPPYAAQLRDEIP